MKNLILENKNNKYFKVYVGDKSIVELDSLDVFYILPGNLEFSEYMENEILINYYSVFTDIFGD